MSRPLVRAHRKVETRLRLLGQKLNGELGLRDQRLQFEKRAMRNGPMTWVLRNDNASAKEVPPPRGTAAELAAARGDDAILYFGYNEEWQLASRRDQIEFVSSNLRFVIAGVDDTPDLRFRLEWAGARTTDEVVCYPGAGSAHPHWQFDVDAGWLEAIRVSDGGPAATLEINLEPASEEIDLEASASEEAARPVSATMAGFHHLHLPARTMWHDMLCSMPDVATPQQHTPASEEEIDRWVVSALRYLRSEFGQYL